MPGLTAPHRTKWRLIGITAIGWMLATSALLAAPPTGVATVDRSRQAALNVSGTSTDWDAAVNPPPGVEPELPPNDWITPRLPPYPMRHVGRGHPLQGRSWLNRPQYVGLFMGSWLGDTLIADRTRQNSGFFSGVWLGHDFNHFWGSELRLSLAYVGTEHLPPGTGTQESRNLLGDVSLLYYPWGDAKWRPFASLGMGVIGFHFTDPDDQPVNETLLHLPWGVGLKYLGHRSMAVRLDVKDNVAFGGSRLNTMHNWSLTVGVELHWGGGSAVRYFPW